MARTITPSSGLANEVGVSSSARHAMTQTVAIKIWIIWKPHSMDGRGLHILENYNNLKNLVITASISMACVLPIDIAEVKKLTDN